MLMRCPYLYQNLNNVMLYRVSQKTGNVWLTSEQKAYGSIINFSFDLDRKRSNLDFETKFNSNLIRI